MPLEQSSSEAAFKHNVAEMIDSGHPQKQALAAAYATKRKNMADIAAHVIRYAMSCKANTPRKDYSVIGPTNGFVPKSYAKDASGHEHDATGKFGKGDRKEEAKEEPKPSKAKEIALGVGIPAAMAAIALGLRHALQGRTAEFVPDREPPPIPTTPFPPTNPVVHAAKKQLMKEAKEVGKAGGWMRGWALAEQKRRGGSLFSSRSLSELIAYVKDASGHEHAGAGEHGGQFVSQGDDKPPEDDIEREAKKAFVISGAGAASAAIFGGIATIAMKMLANRYFPVAAASLHRDVASLAHYVKDASGHEHAGKGEGGGRFVSSGGGELASQDDRSDAEKELFPLHKNAAAWEAVGGDKAEQPEYPNGSSSKVLKTLAILGASSGLLALTEHYHPSGKNEPGAGFMKANIGAWKAAGGVAQQAVKAGKKWWEKEVKPLYSGAAFHTPSKMTLGEKMMGGTSALAVTAGLAALIHHFATTHMARTDTITKYEGPPPKDEKKPEAPSADEGPKGGKIDRNGRLHDSGGLFAPQGGGSSGSRKLDEQVTLKGFGKKALILGGSAALAALAAAGINEIHASRMATPVKRTPPKGKVQKTMALLGRIFDRALSWVKNKVGDAPVPERPGKPPQQRKPKEDRTSRQSTPSMNRPGGSTLQRSLACLSHYIRDLSGHGTRVIGGHEFSHKANDATSKADQATSAALASGQSDHHEAAAKAHEKAAKQHDDANEAIGNLAAQIASVPGDDKKAEIFRNLLAISRSHLLQRKRHERMAIEHGDHIVKPTPAVLVEQTPAQPTAAYQRAYDEAVKHGRTPHQATMCAAECDYLAAYGERRTTPDLRDPQIRAATEEWLTRLGYSKQAAQEEMVRIG